VSSRDEGIGAKVAEAMDKVGKDGVLTVEESQSLVDELVVTEGVSFDKGYLSPYFVTEEESSQAILENPAILLVRDKISSLPDFLPVLEQVAKAGKELFIVAEDVDGEPLQMLVVNSIRKSIKAVAVKAPYFGDRRKAFMDDLAVVTGSTVVDKEVGQ
jgi:chaperonin GroEL